MRFSNDEVMREIEAVVEQIYLFLENVRADWVWALSSSAKSPLPLFAKEGKILYETNNEWFICIFNIGTMLK